MAKRVEEVFVRRAVIIELVIGGRVIRTTAEHPFFVPGRGWTPAAELGPGVALVGGDGEVHVVEDVRLIEEPATVYNLSVADFHTYFVGCDEWGFSVWAHNAECSIKEVRKGAVEAGRPWDSLNHKAASTISRAINQGSPDGWATARRLLTDAGVDVTHPGAVAFRRRFGDPTATPTRAVGDFSNLRGATVQEVLDAVPPSAVREPWKQIPGTATHGANFTWVGADNVRMTVRIHGPDPSAAAINAVGNSATGWIVRVQHGGRFMDHNGNWFTKSQLDHTKPSPPYIPAAANDTHIPIQTPPAGHETFFQ